MGTRWGRALVTGASSGIGEALCRILAIEGTDLVMVARSGDRLDALAAELAPSVTAEVLVADLSDPAELALVEARLSTADQPIDLLVNNAGFGMSGDFLDLDVDVETDVAAVNMVAVLRLSHAAGTRMAAARSGSILNVSSAAGYMPGPGSTTYAATKAFVTAFSIGLHEELSRHGVTVTALCPGFTRTEFQDRAGMDPEVVPGPFWQSADHVARYGLDAVRDGRSVVIPGVHNKIAAGAGRLLPGRLFQRVSAVGRNRVK